MITLPTLLCFVQTSLKNSLQTVFFEIWNLIKTYLEYSLLVTLFHQYSILSKQKAFPNKLDMLF